MQFKTGDRVKSLYQSNLIGSVLSVNEDMDAVFIKWDAECDNDHDPLHEYYPSEVRLYDEEKDKALAKADREVLEVEFTETFNGINLDYDSLCEELNGKVDTAIKLLQEANDIATKLKINLRNYDDWTAMKNIMEVYIDTSPQYLEVDTWSCSSY